MDKITKLNIMKDRLAKMERSTKCIKSGSGTAKALRREIRNLEESI